MDLSLLHFDGVFFPLVERILIYLFYVQYNFFQLVHLVFHFFPVFSLIGSVSLKADNAFLRTFETTELFHKRSNFMPMSLSRFSNCF